MFFIKQPVSKYITKIYDTCPWIIERLDAHFDDVLPKLDPNTCFIYGGVVRDAFANLPFVGDLDILIESENFINMLDTFRFSSRWILKDISEGSKYKPPMTAIAELTTTFNGITKIATFCDKTNTTLQLMCVTKCSREILDIIPCSRSIWDVVCNVDMCSSGLLMSLNGDVYEAVPQAVSDSCARLLTINQTINKKTIDNKRLNTRVNKLVKRGWKSCINLDEYPIKQEKSIISIFKE